MHRSISTITAPEFINLQPLDINPLMSACEIKVLYVGANRNGSYITKEVATNMAKTLRGAPIVGYYKKDKEDFADHGEKVVLDGDGIHFECQTTPYGFVDPAAKVWFKTFTDYDDFGNTIEREYLMTTGYLWTGQFEECKSVVEEGKPHSMELDEKTLKGKWSTNIKEDIEFFIIDDAIFSKLCILGDDVEPCFEGSSVKAPEVSKNFSLDDKFTKTLSNMMEDLKFALKGGKEMTNQENVNTIDTEENVVITVFDEASDSSESSTESSADSSAEENNEDTTDAPTSGEGGSEEDPAEDPADLPDTEVEVDESLSSKKKNDFTKEEEEKEEEKKDESSEAPSEDDDEEEKEKNKDQKYSLLEENFKELETKYSALETEYANLQSICEELTNFKNNIDNLEKDKMIAKFYKLSEEDLKEVKENKAKYTVEEIESKLAVLYFRKGLSFEEETPEVETNSNNSAIITYNLDDTAADLVPDWIKAVELTQKSRNI